MLARLTSAADIPHMARYFYPQLLKHAGQEMAPEGISLMLQLAVYDYTRGLPVPAVLTTQMLLPDIVAALVPDGVARARVLGLIA